MKLILVVVNVSLLAIMLMVLSGFLFSDAVNAEDKTPGCGAAGETKCESKPAIHKGKAKKLGCKGAGFFDPIRGGECWKCPKGYTRTLTHVEGKKACAKNLVFGPWSKAKYVRSVWGCNNKRGEFLDPIDGGQCYKCPDSYNRSISHVKGDKACTVQAKLKCDAGMELKGDTCFPRVDPKEKARVMKEYDAQSKNYASTHESLAADLTAVQVQEGNGDHNARRRALMREELEKHADEGFSTVTLMGVVGGGLVVGYGHARGFAMSGDKCIEVFGNSFTAGVAAGVSGGEEIGIWKGDIDSLAGETNGVQASFSLLTLTFAKGIHWSVGAEEPTGITTMSGGGAGFDFGAEYVHGWTKLRCEKNCDELDWDDIPLLDSDASCNK